MLQTPSCSGIPAPALWMNRLTAPPGLLTGRCTDSKEMHSGWVKMKWMSVCHSGGENNKPLSRRSNLMRWINTWPGSRTCWDVNRPKWVVFYNLYTSTCHYPALISVPSHQCTHLHLRSNQQEAELRRREQQISRLKERLMDRHREKGPCETIAPTSLHKSADMAGIYRNHNIYHLYFPTQPLRCWTFHLEVEAKERPSNHSGLPLSMFAAILIAACWVCVLGTFLIASPALSTLQTRRRSSTSDAGAQRSWAPRGNEAASQPHHFTPCTQSWYGECEWSTALDKNHPTTWSMAIVKPFVQILLLRVWVPEQLQKKPLVVQVLLL